MFFQSSRGILVTVLAWSSLVLLTVPSAVAQTPETVVASVNGSDITQKQVDELVKIPHAPQVESLNAGVAASIVLYEAARQRGEQ